MIRSRDTLVVAVRLVAEKAWGVVRLIQDTYQV
jgi:hypothetical protein